MAWRLRAWLRPGPDTSLGRGLSERNEFRSPKNRDWGKGTRRATPGRQWFWVLLPKQKDLVVRGRNPGLRLSIPRGACYHYLLLGTLLQPCELRQQPFFIIPSFIYYDLLKSDVFMSHFSVAVP